MAKNQKKGGNRSFQDDYYIEPPQVYDYDRQRQSAPPAGRSRAGWKRRQRAAQKQPRRYSVPPQEEDHSRQARRDLQRRKRRRRAARVLTFFAIAVLLAVLVFITLVFVFSVQEVRVSGNTMYTAEQVSAASGVETGDKLLLLHTGEIGETLEKNLPYIRHAQVKRVLPNTVEITVEESQPGFAVDRGDGTYTLLDDDFKVLEKQAKAIPDGVYLISGAALSQDTPGAVVSFDGELIDRSVAILASAVLKNALDEVTEIVVQDANNFVLVYDGRIQMLFGEVDADTIDYKINQALACIDEISQSNAAARGVLNLKNDKNIYFTES